ncbi:hypothetical protein ACTXT7_011495 [Hymenolepis weldensis]
MHTEYCLSPRLCVTDEADDDGCIYVFWQMKDDEFTILEKPHIESEEPKDVRVELGPVHEDIAKKTLEEPSVIPSSRLVK